MRRTKQAAKAFKENTLMRSNYAIPSFASIIVNSRLRKIPITHPKFKTMEDFATDSNDKLFVKMSVENRNWLNNFASDIISQGHIDQYPFYNTSLDYKNPGICAYRIESEIGFVQVQVRQIENNPTLFQLDYFEYCKNEVELKLIGLCNLVNYEHPIVDVVYSTYYEPEKAKDYGSLVATTFQDVMIYVRPWDYSIGTKICTVKPIEIPCWQ